MRLIKFASIILCLAMLLPLAMSCGDDSDAIKLSFKSTLSYDYLKTLDGKKVTINGYVATSSPVDGSFIFLMNMPYQSCPFCVPNTTELSNTIEVFPIPGRTFDYTASAIKVTGYLQVAPSVNEFFTDKYGYKFNFKIIDAKYSVLKSEDMGADFAVWEKFAESGIIDEIYKMYDFVDFVCKWNEYFVNNYTDENGQAQKGYFLYASDAKLSLTKGNKKYGTEEGYFDNLVKKIQKIDPTAFNVLVDNIRQAESLAKKGIEKLNNNEYTEKYQYVEKFDTYDYIYTINGGEALKAELNSVYSGFEEWLGGWEL